MATQDRENQPKEGSFSPLRALSERRVDPGTMKRENVNPPSLLSKQIPRGKDNQGVVKR